MKQVLGVSKQVNSWKDLEVWQVAHSLVLKVYKITGNFPSDERFRLTDQICRAAASIPTNIVEGKGRKSLKEYLQYLLLLAKDLSYLEKINYDEIVGEYDRVSKMLNKLIGSLRTNLPLKTQNRKPITE